MSLIKKTPESYGVELSLEYATANNFTGTPVYTRAGCYVQPEAEGLLGTAIELAA